MNHTPGPWRKGGRDSIICDLLEESAIDRTLYGGKVIVLMVHKNNADLVSAAPDLYEACQELKSALQIAIVARFGDLDRATENQKRILANAAAAIGKAEGNAD